MLLILTTHVTLQHIGKCVLSYYISNKPIVITIKKGNCIFDKYYFGSLSIPSISSWYWWTKFFCWYTISNSSLNRLRWMCDHLKHLIKNVSISRTGLFLPQTDKTVVERWKAINMTFYMMFCGGITHARTEKCLFQSLRTSQIQTYLEGIKIGIK